MEVQKAWKKKERKNKSKQLCSKYFLTQARGQDDIRWINFTDQFFKNSLISLMNLAFLKLNEKKKFSCSTLVAAATFLPIIAIYLNISDLKMSHLFAFLLHLTFLVYNSIQNNSMYKPEILTSLSSIILKKFCTCVLHNYYIFTFLRMHI